MNSLHAEAAAETHDANFIFLLTIIIAVLKAVSNPDVRSGEVWLMMRTYFIFPFMVVGIIGAMNVFFRAVSLLKLFALT